MEVSAKLIAEHLGGEIVGDPEAKVSSVARIESGKPGTLCFLANPVSATLVKVDNAYEAVASLLDLLNALKSEKRRGRAWSAHIAWSARLGKGVYVGSHAYVGRKTIIGSGTQVYPQVYLGDGVTVGENCIIYPGVRVYKGCKIGNNCIIHANAVIGSDGFGFAPTADGTYKKIPQTGIVTIEDDCEIGANTVIDRSTMGTTLIEKGVKLDNLIQVGFAGHITIADRTMIGAQAGLMSDIKEEGRTLLGSPAMDHKDFMRAYAVFRRNGRKQ